MIRRHLQRGLTAGAAAGLLFGLFVAAVGNPLVGYTEGLAHGEYTHAHEGSHAVSGAVTAAVSVGGGILWGLLLGGVVFGAGYYLLEPAIPGTGRTKSYVLAGAGFLTVSGGPWLLFPPRPPGVEAGLPVGTRLLWYGVVAATAALACTLAVLLYRRIGPRLGRGAAVPVALAPFALLAVPLALAPPNPLSGELPTAATTAFRAVVVVGQAGLWLALATAHARLNGRADRTAPGPDDPLPAD